ncbi:MAG: sigma-70 family RNA polymerase sigma factor [Acidobacteriota bacterium]|nr:sigma-70 family RNA polymerase sigma factor [Acidobacteriota bacterium]
MNATSEAILPDLDLTFGPGLRHNSRMAAVDVLPAEDTAADSFRAVVEEHSGMVFRLAWRMTGNVQDAEDVVQDTFLKAHRSFGRFDARASVATWIYRIAVNASIDVIRRRRHAALPRPFGTGDSDPMEALASPDPLPDRMAFAGQVDSRVASALSLLSARERAAFVLRHLEGMPVERIAGVLRIGPNAVKQTVFRAVQKLRRELAPLMGAL